MLVLSEASVKASLSSVSFLHPALNRTFRSCCFTSVQFHLKTTMSDVAEELRCRLQQLQSCFTWSLKEEDLQLDDLNRQLQHDIHLQLGQRGATAHYCRLLAYVRYLQGRPQEALALLSQSEDRTRECYGDDSERRLIVTYGDMAWIHYHHGDQKQAESYCSRVQHILVKHPSGSSELLPEVLGEKGWTLLKFSKSLYPAAIECFRGALLLQPDHWEWNTGLAIALYRTEPHPAVLGTPPEESLATKQLRRALKFSPDDGVLLALLALKLVQQHKYHEAEALVERALVGPDDDQVIRYVAKYLRMQDQLDQSIDLLHRALKGRSQSAFIHHQLGLCYLRKKKNLLSNKPKPEKEVQQWRRLSIHHLEEAIRLKNGLKSAKADLALQYAEESDMKRTSFNLLEELLFLLCFRAQEMFDDVLQELEEESPSIRQSMSRCYAEFCHYHSIQKDVAISFYKKALEFSTNTSDGKHCAKKLKLMAERRLRNNPADGASYGILGYVARAEGDYKRAAGFYEDALEREPENTEFLSVLCELRLQLY
ncbi:interferon-induced protein with tetratricopeptide repeats 5-like isoform X3 [Amphiprion ocellaris]|uniref:interferon-induced protein with tetratricopeptide repeats 5-like isoform X3 n=1 Tax=Amphiprion ocellaris TaxID=80972 RepID=UPI0024117903|nr:interferon-induced protein with tetratricopeptide repeats 5-like isoform X3 [Amphiprion ocellaris]XP_054860851.1 interferon-induced protein with tetratricopeptide repeats 5-like isoform X3 [Amphiprion ocellaris]